MTKITIIIPVDEYEDYEKMQSYYCDVLSFTWRERLFFLPVGSSDVSLKLLIIGKEAKADFPPQKRFPIFSYRIEENFLSYCKKIYENGALIEKAFEYPGGYYALVRDPAGNQFEIECSSFHEGDPTVDASAMPFFFRY
jgi:predicted enzyme related to lactoylglutathione lyase